MHFYMFESFQLERLYVINLLHRFSVKVCSEGTREESKELPVLSLFACIMATLNRNFTGCEAWCMGTWLQVTEDQIPSR